MDAVVGAGGIHGVVSHPVTGGGVERETNNSTRAVGCFHLYGKIIVWRETK